MFGVTLFALGLGTVLGPALIGVVTDKIGLRRRRQRSGAEPREPGGAARAGVGAEQASELVNGLRDVLVAVAEVWYVDHGTICHHELLDELEKEFDLEIRSLMRACGLPLASPRRVWCARGTAWQQDRHPQREARAGSRRLERLEGPDVGTGPELGPVVAMNATLRTTGALVPLSVPMDRSTL